MSNPEEKSVIFKILLLYLLTTGIFLSIFFTIYYDRGYGLIIHEKSSDLREDYITLVQLIDKNGSFDNRVLEKIKILDLNRNFIIYDKLGNILYNKLEKYPKKKYFKGNGIHIFQGYIFIDFYQMRRYKHYKKQLPHPASFNYHIVMKGAYILPDIWHLRLKTAGFLLLSLIGVGMIAYSLLKLSLRPLQNKISFLDRFIKDTTHEINTPVSIILMSIERLDQKKFSSDNIKKINRIQVAAKTIASIYQNLLFYNFSKSIGEIKSIDMKTILEQRLDFFTPLLHQKHIKLNISLKPTSINANEDEIKCIIDNILNNAIKYNKPDGGQIWIDLKIGQLCIKDNGCGIKTELKDKIFERYSRFNDSQGGFGIGLALVKELCKRHKIKITYDSQPSKGSLFCLKW
ncbi:hypothetical protein BKH44_00005 [Helicobacter sp. 13S00477-4]|nr:hypothetical protein BKH44_00005 [Helicobacter sp. 13S00477-4]